MLDLSTTYQNLTVTSLKKVLKLSKLQQSGVKDKLITRLLKSNVEPVVILSNAYKVELIAMCEDLKLKTKGDKAQLIKRLLKALVIPCSDTTNPSNILEDVEKELSAFKELKAC